MPELVFDTRDGEWSVLLPSGEMLSDLAACLSFQPADVRALGNDAHRLNSLNNPAI